MVKSRGILAMAAVALLAACSGQAERHYFMAPQAPVGTGLHAGETAEIRALIDKWADHYGVPRSLVHRSVQRESGYNPGARNGSYYGLMQIAPQTARTMGHRGAPAELLDADTNLKYAVKYMRGAWLCADGSEDRAMSWFAKGYYYEAKRRGILAQTGLRS